MKSTPWTATELKQLKKLVEDGQTGRQIADLLSRSFDSIETKIRRLGLSATVLPVKLPKLDPPKFGRLPLAVVNSGDWIRFGLVADTHLASKEERLSELHAQYDLFQTERITQVFHAGNLVDGYVPRINGGSG